MWPQPNRHIIFSAVVAIAGAVTLWAAAAALYKMTGDVVATRTVLSIIGGIMIFGFILTLTKMQFFHRDTTTGVFQRHVADHYLKQAVNRHRVMTVALLDVNGFKGINDTYGHEKGDEFLRELTERLLPHFGIRSRTGRVIVRMGGDEFAVLCWKKNVDLEVFAAEIQEVLIRPHTYGDWPIASVGVAQSQNPRLAVRAADLAMYRAKAQFREGGVCFPAIYDKDLDNHQAILDRPPLRVRDMD